PSSSPPAASPAPPRPGAQNSPAHHSTSSPPPNSARSPPAAHASFAKRSRLSRIRERDRGEGSLPRWGTTPASTHVSSLQRRPPRMPLRRLLVRMPRPQHRHFIERPPGQLHAYRQP